MHKQAAKYVSCADQAIVLVFPPFPDLAITLSEAKIRQTQALIYTLFFIDNSRHVWNFCVLLISSL